MRMARSREFHRVWSILPPYAREERKTFWQSWNRTRALAYLKPQQPLLHRLQFLKFKATALQLKLLFFSLLKPKGTTGNAKTATSMTSSTPSSSGALQRPKISRPSETSSRKNCDLRCPSIRSHRPLSRPPHSSPFSLHPCQVPFSWFGSRSVEGGALPVHSKCLPSAKYEAVTMYA